MTESSHPPIPSHPSTYTFECSRQPQTALGNRQRQTRPDQTRGVISLCIWGTSPTHFASLPQQFVSFPQQFCFISPTNLLHFPNNFSRFPNKLIHFPKPFSHFPNTILCNFAKNIWFFFSRKSTVFHPYFIFAQFLYHLNQF